MRSVSVQNSGSRRRCLLDRVNSPAFVAYSSSTILRSGYKGPLIRVRRSSDNVELDIGQRNRKLDVSMLLGFLGATSGFIRTVYDQSGNGRDVGQTTAGAQPRIVNSGVLEVIGTKPAIVFDGTDDLLTRADAFGLTGSPNLTILNTYRAPFAGSQFLWGFGESGIPTNSRWQMFAADTSDSALGVGITQGGPTLVRSLISWSGGAATQVAGLATVQTKPASSNTSSTNMYFNGSGTPAVSQGTANNGPLALLNDVFALGCASSLTSFGAQALNLWVGFNAVLSGDALNVANEISNQHRF